MVFVTIFSYFIFNKIFKNKQFIFFHPAIASPILVIIILFNILDLDFSTYNQVYDFSLVLLGPLTTSFAVPIYQFRKIILENKLVIFLGVFFSIFINFFATLGFYYIFNFEEFLKNTLFARSISTPFAVMLTEKIQGDAKLVAVLTMITGIIGMIFGNIFLKIFPKLNLMERGISFGCSAHGSGVAISYISSEKEGVIASISMILAGIITVVLIPFLINFI